MSIEARPARFDPRAVLLVLPLVVGGCAPTSSPTPTNAKAQAHTSSAAASPAPVAPPLSFEEAMRALPESYSLQARNGGSPGAFPLKDIRVAADERWGWAVGELGTIVRLEGSGPSRRWVPDPDASALTRRALYGLDVSADGRSGWAVGEAGVVLRLEDGRWRLDEAASQATDERLRTVAVDKRGAKGLAIAASPGRAPQGCTSVILGPQRAAPGPSCGESVDIRECALGHDDVDVWLRCVEPCPEPDDPYREGPHLWRLGPSEWILEAKCDKASASLPAAPTPRHAAGWSVSGHEIFKRGSDGRVEAQLRSPPHRIVLPSFETLPLTIEREDQLLDQDSGDSTYRLRLSVSHRVSRDRLEAALVALDRMIMGELGAEPYGRFVVDVTFHPSEEDIAQWSRHEGKRGRFDTALHGGTLEGRLRHFLVGHPIDDYVDWGYSGCYGEELTVSVQAKGTHGTVVLSTSEKSYTGWPECAIAVAHVALARIEEIESLTVRLEGASGPPFLELTVQADDFLELNALDAFNTRDHDLHHVYESGLSKRQQKKKLREIKARWHRDVGSKLAPHVLYYRGWDRP